MLVYLISCLLAAAVLPWLVLRIQPSWRPLTGLLPLVGFIYFMTAPDSTEIFSWFGQDTYPLSLKLDGLSRLFALLITGIGALVFAYSGKYLAKYPAQPRFYGFMSLFMGAMLGVVLSNDLYLLFICWELTSISSFFLIGLNTSDEDARKSAFRALVLTGTGGLALLGAAVLLHFLSGSTQIDTLSGLLAGATGMPFFTLAFGLVCLAAFTKSAQFPFHFWLPGAMAAPTPISAYLHSATMVKAGIYLLLRFFPVMSLHPWWEPLLTAVGGFTMLYAGIHSLFRYDLKAILAYTTVAALGMLVFFIGQGTPLAIQATLLFIVVHALYKAALFLLAGGIDHAVHNRNVLDLSGLRKGLPGLALGGLVAALLNGGFPPLLSFISKDLMYEALLDDGQLMGVVVLMLANVCLIYSGFQVGVKPFLGAPVALKIDKPSIWIWLPTVLLGFSGALLGLFPGLLAPYIGQAAMGMGMANAVTLKLFHGFNAVLYWSLATLGAGILLYRFWPMRHNRMGLLSPLFRVAPATIFSNLSMLMLSFAKAFTSFFQHGYLRYYVMTVVTFLMFGISFRISNMSMTALNFDGLLALTFYELGTVVILTAALFFAVVSQSRLATISALGVVGFAICLLFVFYSAPDLAITQFAVDTLTVILFVLVLYRLPKYRRVSRPWVILRDAVVSMAFGGLIALLAMLVLQQPVNREVANYYAANSYLLAKGKNVVNVILVDFRGADTLVEITVLCIAALGVYSLLKLRLKSAERNNRA